MISSAPRASAATFAGALPVGTYELRIRVSAGGQEVARSAFFTLQ